MTFSWFTAVSLLCVAEIVDCIVVAPLFSSSAVSLNLRGMGFQSICLIEIFRNITGSLCPAKPKCPLLRSLPG
jgi:hypothetical protein